VSGTDAASIASLFHRADDGTFAFETSDKKLSINYANETFSVKAQNPLPHPNTSVATGSGN
jgi:hypothetical protein